MAVRLKKFGDFSGKKATIYVVLNELGENPFREFAVSCGKDYEDKLLNFIGRIKSIGTQVGAIEDYFKLHENERKGVGDNVCALYDVPDKEMRLYCVRISEQILILGGGGPKPEHIRAWQDCPILSKAARYMISISETIKTRLQTGTLAISDNGMEFTGDLVIIK